MSLKKTAKDSHKQNINEILNDILGVLEEIRDK